MTNYFSKLTLKAKKRAQAFVWRARHVYIAAFIFFISVLAIYAPSLPAALKNASDAYRNAALVNTSVIERERNAASAEINAELIRLLKDEKMYAVGHYAEPSVFVYLLNLTNSAAFDIYDFKILPRFLQENGQYRRTVSVSATGAYEAAGSYLLSLDTGRFCCQIDNLSMSVTDNDDIAMFVDFSFLVDPSLDKSIYSADTGIALIPRASGGAAHIRANPFIFGD